MPEDGLTRLSACVLDSAGLLQIRADGEHFSGVLSTVPATIRVGDTLHLTMQMPVVSADGSTTQQENVEIMGALVIIEGGNGPIPITDGLVFELDVVRTSHEDAAEPVPAAEAVLPRPPEPLFLRALQQLDAADAAERASTARAEDDFSDVAPASEAASVVEAHASDTIDNDPQDDDVAAPLAEYADYALDRAAAYDDDDDAYDAHLDEELRDALEDSIESPLNVLPPGWGDDEQHTSRERVSPRRRAEAMFESTEPSGIVGTLRDMTLPEVVQSLEFGGKTAEVRVKPREGKSGVVFLERGQVVYARCGTVTGDEAFFTLADESRGAFLIKFHGAAPSRNVFMPTGYLLLELVRRRDEADRDRMSDPIARPPAELPPPPVEDNENTAQVEALAEDVEDTEVVPHVTSTTPHSPADELPVLEPVNASPAPVVLDADMPATEPEGFRLAVSADFERLVDAALDSAAYAAAELDGPTEDERNLPAYEEDDQTRRIPAHVSTPTLAIVGATAEASDSDVDEVDEEPEIISVEDAPFAKRVATGAQTLVFSSFFQEASEEGIQTGFSLSDDVVTPDDEPDPTFSSLAVALRGLRASDDHDLDDDDDDTAVRPYRTVNTSDSHPSFGH